MIVIGASAVEARQAGRISGEVVDAATRAPVGQVQVFLQGTSYGTLTRQDGRFLILNVPAGTYTVRAERIGMTAVSQEVTVASGEIVTANFTMASQALGLDEIVVTGAAGASRRREVGNTIAQIDVTNLPDKPVNVTDILQASAPGIDVMAAGGEVGQGKVIRLRGNSSVSMSNQPIIYIDGIRMMSGNFPMTSTPDYRAGRGANVTASPLDNINPNDIERIEVIKGSAATTLYGTEASAGVIQIFTKRGSQGAPVWTVETQHGTAWSRQFGTDDEPYLWMDEYFRGAYSQMYAASVRGGGQNLQYFASGQAQGERGILPNDDLEKWVIRGNFTFTPIDELQIQWNTGYTNQWQKNTPTGNNAQGLTLNVFRQNQNYFGTGDPVRMRELLKFDVQQVIERFTTGGTATYSPMANLTNRFTIGYDFSQQEARNLRPFGFEPFPQGALGNNTWHKRLLTFDYVGTFSRDLMGGLRTNISWGGQAVGDDERNIEAFGENFPGAAAPTVSSASLTIGNEDRQKIWNAGFFGQNVFDLSNRYFLTLGFRMDGNSAFGSNFGLQFYPKASASWVASDEGFWNEGWGEMKVRIAYGRSGRAPGAFDAVRTWNSAGWAGQPAFVPQNVGNPDLGPEVTAELEGGFDASWFENRVRAAFTYYSQTTSDALLSVGQIPSGGFTQSQLQNVGKLSNKGMEISLDGSILQGANFGWDAGVTLSTNNSKVLDLGGIAPFSGGGGWIQEGHPVPAIRTTVILNPDEITTRPGACSTTVTTSCVQLATNQITGPMLPTHTMTANTSVRLPRGISLSATGEYRGGNMQNVNPISISRSVRSPLCYPYYANNDNVTLVPELPALWRARCTPSLGQGYWFDADFFKLRSVSATVPVDFAFPDRFSNAVLTLALNNSFLWMREIPWMDPEILGNQAANSAGLGATERIPGPISFRTSLRVTF